jgi:enoyl-CoA hydratase/carnithine racemase
MNTFETITLQVKGPVARVRLNRPDVRNALSFAMVEELLACFTALRDDPAYHAVRAVVLCAGGKTFCAGGDLRDMTRPAEEQQAALAQVDALLRAINQAPQVVIARVQGAALGGGLGLVCVADIAIAGFSASFGLPEAQLGVAPAMIAPYVLARLGFTRTRELMLTGQRFDYAAAHTWGLVQHYCADFELDGCVRLVLRDVLRAAPEALRACKELLFTVAAGGDTLDYRVALLERLRTSEEARQGAQAFLRKKPAPWEVEHIEDFDDAEDA